VALGHTRVRSGHSEGDGGRRRGRGAHGRVRGDVANSRGSGDEDGGGLRWRWCAWRYRSSCCCPCW
jgi:hypothetical protein